MFDERNRLIIKDYMNMPPFSKGLPGITGPLGIPMWCLYVNRGQAAAGFGSGASPIMPYRSSGQAYRDTGRLGFRTFIRTDKGMTEPFTYGSPADMHIGLNELYLEQDLDGEGFRIGVLYYILPGEEIGALVRQVTVRNRGEKEKEIEILDGLPVLTPYGYTAASGGGEDAELSAAFLKTEKPGRKAAFFHCENHMEPGWKAHFAAAFSGQGEMLPIFTEPEVLFGYDSAMTAAHRFGLYTIEQLQEMEPERGNRMPCCFFGRHAVLPPGRAVTVYELFGTADNREGILSFMEKGRGKSWFGRKYGEAARLAAELSRLSGPGTGNGLFNYAVRQAWLANIMQGGEPVLLGGRHVYYLYSGAAAGCCCGFKPAPSLYSQAPGDSRRIIGCRNNGMAFRLFMEETAVRQYFCRIQMNGMAAQIMGTVRYFIPDWNLPGAAKLLREKGKDGLIAFLSRPFTPGELYHKLGSYPFYRKSRANLFEGIIKYAEEAAEAGTGEYRTGGFGEGLALLKAFLAFYPERKESLLFLDTSYTYPPPLQVLCPVPRRFVKTGEGIRQENFLEKGPGKEREVLRDKNGHILYDALIDKLILLCTVKMTSLDPYGMGLLMECGNSGDNVFLDGLPRRMGSSMREACDLLLLVEFTAEALEGQAGTRLLPEEGGALMRHVCKAIRDNLHELTAPGPAVCFWKRITDAREAFEEEVRTGISGSRMAYGAEPLLKNLLLFRELLEKGVEKAVYYGEGICPSHFYYEITSFETEEKGIRPTGFRICHPPCFLEGPAAYLGLTGRREEKREMYAEVKESGLYDEKLKRWRLNAPLSDKTQRLGRLNDCTPGFAGDGAVCGAAGLFWLVGLLKSGLYEEFTEEFKSFLSDGREELVQNSAFRVSSLYEREGEWGLAGLPDMGESAPLLFGLYRLLLFGERPFFIMEGELKLSFTPLLPACLVGEEGYMEAYFIENTAVVYRLCDREDYIPGNYRIESITLQPGSISINGAVIGDGWAEKIRAGRIKQIEVRLERGLLPPEGRNPNLEGTASARSILYGDEAAMEKGQFPGYT